MSREIDQQDAAQPKKTFPQFFKPIKKRQWIVLATVLFLVADIVIVVQVFPFLAASAAASPTSDETVMTTQTETTATTVETTVETTAETTIETVIETTAAPTEPKPTSAPKPASPLEAMENNFYSATREQAMALFDSIDSLSDIISKSRNPEILYFMSSPSSPHEYSYLEAFMAYETGCEFSFVYRENYDTSMLELRLYSDPNMKIYNVMASKPLPSGYTQVDTYDCVRRNRFSKNCITQATLDKILAAGQISPFVCGYKAPIDFVFFYRSESYDRVGAKFYMPATRTTVFIVEDYTAKLLYYSFDQVDDGKKVDINSIFENSVPLNPAANYAAFGFPD